MNFTGTTARDNYVGTIDPDEFDMSQGGRDTVSGLDGDDVFIFGTEFNANDQIDGGAGFQDTLVSRATTSPAWPSPPPPC